MEESAVSYPPCYVYALTGGGVPNLPDIMRTGRMVA